MALMAFYFGRAMAYPKEKKRIFYSKIGQKPSKTKQYNQQFKHKEIQGCV
jgi:hypothetical protein